MHFILLYPHLYSKIQPEITSYLKQILLLAKGSPQIYERDEATSSSGAIFFPQINLFCLKDSTFSYSVNKQNSTVVRSQALEFQIMPLPLTDYRPWAS